MNTAKSSGATASPKAGRVGEARLVVRIAQTAVNEGIAHGTVERTWRALVAFDPILRGIARRRIAQRWDESHRLHPDWTEAQHLRWAYVALHASSAERESWRGADADTVQVAYVSLSSAEASARRPRGGPWLTLGIMGALIAGLSGAFMLHFAARTFDPARTALGDVLVSALADPAGSRTMMNPFDDGRAGLVLEPQQAQDLEHILMMSREPDAEASEPENLKTLLASFNASLRRAGQPYFVGSATTPSGAKTRRLGAFYVEVERTFSIKEKRLGVLHGWPLPTAGAREASRPTSVNEPRRAQLIWLGSVNWALLDLEALERGLLGLATLDMELPVSQRASLGSLRRLAAERYELVRQWRDEQPAGKPLVAFSARLISSRRCRVALEAALPAETWHHWQRIQRRLEASPEVVIFRTERARAIERLEARALVALAATGSAPLAMELLLTSDQHHPKWE